MATGSNSFTPDSLLAHEPFVRAVVRNLLKDEHRVQDVLQETWIRALRKAPAEGGPQKGWLAQVARRIALDQHRGSARREQREREVARDEALESVDMLHARLEAQRAVVDAVLALEEPYKSVVLLSYYEQLSPQAIGARLGRSAATVRSQLSRAHEILKHKLDQEHGGERAAWAGVLCPWAITTKSNAGWLVAAGLGVVLVGAGAWMLPRNATTRTAEPALVALAASSEPSSSPNLLVSEPANSTREALAAQPSIVRATATQLPDVSTLAIEDLQTLAVQAMRVLEAKLLTPDPRFAEQCKQLLALPDTGIARLLSRTDHGSTKYEGLIFPREGGAYFSFATGSHDYDREPDIEYSHGHLSAGFYGLQVGVLLSVGDQPLESLAVRESNPPATLSPRGRKVWEQLFFQPQSCEASEIRPWQSHLQQELGAADVPGKVGETLLLRVFSPDEHDHLVALRVLEQDEESVTLAWRILLRFPRPGTEAHKAAKPSYSTVPAAPSWLESLRVDELVALLHSIRRVSEPKLLDVPDAARSTSAWLQEGAKSCGWFRLLPEHQFAPLTEFPGKGAFYSIDRRAHVEYYDADVGMPFGEFSSGVAGGNLGWMVGLGELTRDELAGVLVGEAPRRLTRLDQDKLTFLWETRSVLTPSGRDSTREVTAADFARADELRLRCPIDLKASSSFVLRSIRTSGADQLLLMTVLESSKDGMTLCWRELKRFDG